MEKCQAFAKWTKEFGKEVVEKYTYIHKLYLSREENINNDIAVLDFLGQNPFFQNISTVQELESRLSQNTIFEVAKGIDATFRQGSLTLCDGKVQIENCVFIFLSNKKSWYNDLKEISSNAKENVL